MAECNFFDLNDDNRSEFENEAHNSSSIVPVVQENFLKSEPSSGLHISHVESLPTGSAGLFDFGSTSPTNGNTVGKRSRKSMLIPVTLEDDLEFQDDMDVSTEDTDYIPSAEVQNGQIKISDRLRNIREMPNPNVDLISKASFLRVSVAFLMRELGYKQLQIGNNTSIASLKAQYVRNKNTAKRKEQNNATLMNHNITVKKMR